MSNLCVEAGIREAEDKGSEDREILVRGDVGGVTGVSLSNVGVEGEVDKHEEVAEHADDEPSDHNGVSALPRCQVTKKPKYCSARHLANCHKNRAQSCQSFPES